MNGFLLFNRIIYEVINRLSNKYRLEEIKMKKVLTGIAVILLVVSIGSTSAYAAGHGRGRNFVDNDGNGVCDNYDSNGC